MNELTCLVRADASAIIGAGHVVRTRTLAIELRRRGWRIWFAARSFGGLSKSLKETGELIQIPDHVAFDSEPELLARVLPKRVDLCVTDHYHIDSTWQSSARGFASTILAIDDLAAAPQNADIVLNQNLGRSVSDYSGLVPQSATVLIGPAYALLRPEFAAARASITPRDGQLRRVFVSFGGGDAPNVTSLASVACILQGLPADIVVGPANPHYREIRQLALAQPFITLHERVQDMVGLMASADLAIGAPGSASWERCALGLPTILVILADNQTHIAASLVASGSAVSLGWYHDISAKDIVQTLGNLQNAPTTLREMGMAAGSITDGLGLYRVVAAIEQRLAR